MTTIAVKDGIMACDSKCTDKHGSFSTKIKKVHRLTNGALFGQSGDVDVRLVLELLSKATAKKLPSRWDLSETYTSVDGILAFANGRVFSIDVYQDAVGETVEWNAQVMEVEERFFAVGTGSHFALGAMKAGRSAAEAVAIACHFDSFSQPPVKEYLVREAPARKR